ncbi:MAG TPA: FHA domain-containing protein [Polyangiaceae bacterium]|nr:FHA domain-containing protein [Polyangiaceae bacterium]
MIKPAPEPLRAPIMIVCPQGELRLARGAVTIGRHSEADIRLDDVLVSRLHARLSVLDDGAVLVEDLHSRNGVYVNGTRLSRGSERLREGDRLLIGTFELGVFSARGEDAPGHAVKKLRMQRIDTAEPPPTDRAEGLILLARLAERLAREGKPDEAVRTLAEQLHRVLLGAGSGLKPSQSLLEHAAEYAVKLFGWSQNRAWVEYVFELHLAAQCVPSEACIALLEATLASGRVVLDPNLVRYFDEFVAASAADSAHKQRLRALLAPCLVADH